MPKRRYVQEAASLAKKSADGTYRVVLITEGEGSSGRYSAGLIDRSEHVFEGAPSFLNHPIDPNKPHLRPVESIAGRFTNVEAEDGPQGRQLSADYKPRKEYAEFVEEFQDIVGLSIYCGADGEVLEDGRLDVHEFDANDPYRSVDIVVAAGRGGRFKRAEESLRAIESSLGLPEGHKPGATAAPGEKESNMEKEVLEAVVKAALAEALAPVVAFVAEQKAAADAAVAEAEAKAAAAEQEKDAAIESYSAAVKAVSEAALFPSQKDEILTAAKAGEDIAPLLENAKKVVAEASQAAPSGYTIESRNSDSAKKSFALKGGRH